MKVISTDINGKPLDEASVKLPEYLAKQCIEIAERK